MERIEKDIVVDELKKTLASAMKLGMACSQSPLSGTVFDSSNEQILSGVVDLHKSTRDLLSASELDHVDVNEVVPLVQEIVGRIE